MQDDNEIQKLSKSAMKKLQKRKEKEDKKSQTVNQQTRKSTDDGIDVSQGKYGLNPIVLSQGTFSEPDKVYEISTLNDQISEKVVVIARIFSSRLSGKKCFIVARQKTHTLQCLAQTCENVSTKLVKFAGSINLESIVKLGGTIVKTPVPVKCSQENIELHIDEIWVINTSLPRLPLMLHDAMRSKLNNKDDEKSALPSANQDTRLDNRILDLRTPTNQAIFKMIGGICKLFREYLDDHDFLEIYTPKLISGSSEGGANVFKLKYFKTEACLAQSPQLYKQMAIAADFERVYTIGPVFRAEDSNTHRHLTEFTGMDIEMSFQSHYHEVMTFVGRMFEYMFENIEKRYKKEINVITQQYPFEKFEYLSPTLVLEFPKAVEMLRSAGVEIEDYEDLSTTNEKILGSLVKKLYKTDFYILDKFPLDIRAFYTMPDPNNKKYSNSYDMFMRGEEMLSGAQRIHDPSLLIERAKFQKIDINTIKQYIDAFNYGVKPHAGAGIGMERVLMLYLGLDNIRKTCMFPRDPKRLTP